MRVDVDLTQTRCLTLMQTKHNFSKQGDICHHTSGQGQRAQTVYKASELPRPQSSVQKEKAPAPPHGSCEFSL